MRRLIGLLAAGLVIASTGVVVAADDTIRTIGDENFVPNVMIQATLKFQPGSTKVASGDDLTVQHDDRTTAPHTLTIVDPEEVPTTLDEVFGCGACQAALAAHFPAGPPVPVVNVGAAGLDAPGDSLLFFDDQSVSAAVSAPSGTTLAYVCAIHPWMQGEIQVQ